MTPWAWVPSVNFAQGLQYAIVVQLFVVVFKTMGVANAQALFWASFISLPWTLKPLWGPIVDGYWTKRSWTVWMQFLVGLGLLGCGIAMQLPAFFTLTVVALFIIAFASATHDIACDGYYMLALTERQQAFYVGIRSTAFRVAMIVANGGLVAIAGIILATTGPKPVDLIVQAQAAGAEAPAAVEAAAPQEIARGSRGFGIIVEPSNVQLAADTSTTVTVRLSDQPEGERRVVVTLAIQEKGNVLKRLFVPKGPQGMTISQERLEFTRDDWNEPQPIVVKSDKKTAPDASVTYRVAAGNIPWSWTMVLMSCGVLYLLFASFHGFVMPHPAADASKLEGKPPFHIPLISLFIAVGIPTIIVFLLFALMDKAQPGLKETFLGENPTSLETKKFSFLFRLGNWLVILALFGLVLTVPFLKKPASMFFYKMSDMSGIGFADVFVTFFQKQGILIVLGFLLTFRLGEAQLAQVKQVFLIEPRENLGLGLTLTEFGFINTVFYIGFLTVGGVLGGLMIARLGLRKSIWFMVAGMHLPNLLYVWMASVLPESVWPIRWAVGIEAFGYGFGFTAYLMVMIMAAQGPYKTAHYALCTGFMALGYMVPGMWSGYLQELVGYSTFFWLVMLFCIPGVLFIPFLPIDPKFGQREKTT
jgi:PAT family beta-lactamase induction signal transducer AmpG